MDGINEIIATITTALSQIIIPLAILVLIGCGLWYMLASRAHKEEVMDKLKNVLIGTVIALSAASIITWIADKLSF